MATPEGGESTGAATVASVPRTVKPKAARCFYVLFDRYRGLSEEYRAEGHIVDREVRFDYTDTLRPHLFVFKGLGDGPFGVDITFRSESSSRAQRYRGDLILKQGSTYRVRWPEIPDTVPPSRGILSAESVPEDYLLQLMPASAIPSCAAVVVGVTWTL